MDIQERLSPHSRLRKAGAVIDAIVLHDTVSWTTENTLGWFQNPASKVSAHYVIGRDGAIWRCVPEDRSAWHAGASSLWGREGLNDYSIGIEIVDARDDDGDPYPEPQMKALIDLTVDLCRRHGIWLNRIVGHQHICLPPGRKADPGLDFPWRDFLIVVGARLGEGLP